MKKIIPFGVLGLVLSAGWFFSHQQKVVLAFNEKIVALMAEYKAPMDQFWKVFGIYYEGEPVDIEAVQSAQKLLAETCDRIAKSLKEIEVPSAEGCELFYEAVEEYAAINQEIAAAYGKVVAYVEEHNPVKTEADQAFLNELIDPLVKRQNEAWAKVKVLQVKLSEEHDFELE